MKNKEEMKLKKSKLNTRKNNFYFDYYYLLANIIELICFINLIIVFFLFIYSNLYLYNMNESRLSTTSNSFLDENDRTTHINFQANNKCEAINNKIPDKLKKTFYCTFSLFIVGIILFLVGTEEAIRNYSFKNGIAFWIIAFIILIPGAYYTYQFYKAQREKDIEIREEILDEIPVL